MLESEPKDQWLWHGLGPAREPAPAPATPAPVELAPEMVTVPEPQPPAPTIAADPAVSSWAQGRMQIESCMYPEALESYRTVLVHRPEHLAARFNAASCLERLGRHSEALAEFDHCLDKHPGSVEAILGKALALHRMDRLEEALALYSAVPPSADGYAGVLANMIAIAAARREFSKLREYGAELLKLQRQSQPALVALMQADMIAGDYRAAAQHGLRLIKLNPGSYEAWFNLGVCYQRTDRHEQAAQAYTEAIRIRPDALSARANMGVILLDHGDVSAARREFEHVLQLEPGNLAALWNFAIICEKDGQPERAEKIYLGLIRDQHNVFAAAFRLALLRMGRKDFIGATEAFGLCLVERPGDVHAAINLSLARWRSGDLHLANGGIQVVLAKEPGLTTALHLRGALSIDANDWRTASEVEARLGELGENTAWLTYNIGVLQQTERLPRDAAKSFERASDQKPGFAEALVNSGHALKQCGKATEAATAWKAALQAMPELAGEYFNKRTASMAV